MRGERVCRRERDPSIAVAARLAKDSVAIRMLSSSCRRLRVRKMPAMSRAYRAADARPKTAAIDSTTLNPDASPIARIPPATVTPTASAPAASGSVGRPRPAPA